MAGGLFGMGDESALFTFNVKCIVFALILMIAFAVAPYRSYWVLSLIPALTAVLVFAYHELYACRTPIRWAWLMGAALATMAAYWFLPERTRTEPVMYFFIFVYGYVAMAFYDYVFRCSVPLETGLASISGVFKPDASPLGPEPADASPRANFNPPSR